MPSYTITLEKHEGEWWAWCQALPQCRARGKNRKQAYAAIKENITHYIEECLKHGKPVPLDRTTTKFFRLDLQVLRRRTDLR